jgi:glycosyltransferase involved in cell wall biosynthesis
LKIALLISGHLETLTGGYVYDRRLIEYFRNRGHEVRVIYFHGPNYFSRLVSGFSLSMSGNNGTSPPDILLEDELDHPALFRLNRRLRQRNNYPIVSIVHHLRSCEMRAAWQNNIYRRVEKRYLGSVDGFIFNSLTTQNIIQKLVRAGQPSIVAYPCGDRLTAKITEKDIIDRATWPGPLQIIFLGNLISRKSLHILIAALAGLPENTFNLTVIGGLSMDKPYVRSIQNQIAHNRLEARVTMLGSVSDTELAARLKASQVLAVPSSYEGFGLAYLEGMGFGLPAIGSRAGATGEVIQHDQNGLLIEVGDSSTLARYLYGLYTDRQRLIRLSLNALQTYRAHPTWRTTGEKVLTFLQSLTDPDHRRINPR